MTSATATVFLPGASATATTVDPPGPYQLPPKTAETVSKVSIPSQEHQEANEGEEIILRIVSSESKEFYNDRTTTNTTCSNGGGDNGSIFRKQLGCRRRVADDMIMSSSDEEDDDEEDTLETRQKLFFTSPRLMEPDESLFPTTNHASYQKSEERWQHISEQAGSHRQDGTVITIGRKVTPMALRIGMTQQAARRVRSLNLWLDHDKDILPEWLDVISQVFHNLEHLTLTEDIFPGEDELAVSARMRRLYVLYRLPFLKSIDDMIVTQEERRMARPNEHDPNGHRIVSSRNIPSGWHSLLDDTSSNNRHHTINNNNPCDDKTHDENDNHEDCWGKNQQQHHHNHHLAHEMPVEIIHDKFSPGVVNDGRYGGDENDDLGQIPKIPASLSNSSSRTAKEVGVEINQELAQKFAELRMIATATTSTTTTFETSCLELDEIFDGDDELVGEAMLSDLAVSSEEVGSETRDYSDEVSQCASGGGTDDGSRMAVVESQEISFTSHRGAVEVDLAGKLKPRLYISHNDSRRVEGPTPDRIERIDQWRNGLRSQILDTADTTSIELVSVASTDHEWSAACGVLSFRSDRTCAPRLRMPFSSRHRNVLAADAAVRAIRQAKVNVRNKKREKIDDAGKPCTPVARNDTVNTPQVGCCNFGSSKPKFFPDRNSSNTTCSRENPPSISANKQLPPSKSLSSPFPMQFRDRQITHSKAHLAVETSQSNDSGKWRMPEDSKTREMETISSPLHATNSGSSSSPKSREQKKLRASKGDLPPPCPSGTRRKVLVPSTQTRKSKRRLRHMKASKENARSTSVMDLEEDEDDDDNNEDEIFQKSRSTDSGDDSDSLAYK